MPTSASSRVQLHPSLTGIINKYTDMEDELNTFYASLRTYLETGIANRIFPCQLSKIESFLGEMPSQARQVSLEPEVIVVTGRRALVAVNSFIFSRSVLLDEVFFRSKTLFIIGSQQAAGLGPSQQQHQQQQQVWTRVQIYNNGKLTAHQELHFDCLQAMNEHLAKELITVEFDREFDGLLVEIGLQCQQLGRFRVATAPRVDSVIKELLDPMLLQQQHRRQQDAAATTVRHRVCLMLHYFCAVSQSQVEQRAEESELNYVCGLAAHSRLLLACEHQRGSRDVAVARMQRFEEGPAASVRVCYYTDWQWDGLSSVQPELERLLAEQLHRRTTQLTKTATRELSLPFKVVHQIKRDINLCRNMANRQRRPVAEYTRDFAGLRDLAGKTGDSFRRLVDSLIRDASERMAVHLRNVRVRGRILRAILGRAPELKGGSEHKLEVAFLEVVAAEIRKWNASSQTLSQADEQVHQAKMDKFRALCTAAGDIPEIILVSTDMLSASEHSSPPHGQQSAGDSSESRVSMHSVVDHMVQRRLRAGRLENFAAGIAAPLWVPLAAITMAIIAPVIGARKGQQSAEKFQAELKGLAQDFLDRLDSQVIRTQLFARVKERLDEDAKRLREFVEYYCILPADAPASPSTAGPGRRTDETLMQHLSDLENQLQFLHSGLMMLQVEKLGCEVLSREACRQLGVDTDIDDWAQLGAEMVRNKPVYLVTPPDSAQKPLVLKVAAKGVDSHRLLLEIDIVKAVSAERHSNIIPWLGTVYFPRLHTIGFLTNKYDCNLWEFLQRFESLAVPYRHPAGSAKHSGAFAVCRNACDQIFSGVHLLHTKQILHRDLKLENVLVDIQCATEPLRIVAKLCDFGLAKHESEMSGTTFGGTNGYMAPEIQQNKPLYSNKSDIYALGVIAWECYFGQLALASPGALRTLKSGNGLWDFLVESMTCQTATERPLIEQCRVLLREFVKKPQEVSPLEARLSRTVPSLQDSLLALGRTVGISAAEAP